MQDEIPELNELLTKLVSTGGSDLHLKVGSPPAYRIDGALHLAELPPLNPQQTEGLLGDLVPDRLRAAIDDSSDLDFAYGEPGLGRFRVSSYRQRGSINIVVRSVAPASKTFTELGLPESVSRVCDERDGLILVTGPTGSGKTTTCAAIIDYINTSRRSNIITIEDPIEVLHKDKRAIVSQREVGVDTPSYAAGMASVIRQDPDVIYVGELRDQETMEAALVAAETGHLVISTMYTIDAVETVHRILDTFPPYLERRIRQMLGTSLRAIVSQRLIPKIEGPGRVPAVEVMFNTEAVRERLVDTEKMSTLFEQISEGSFYGMQTFDQAITELYEAGEVSFSDALLFVTSPRDFKLATGVMTSPGV
ncbi:MAG: type IV pilus twitching motility protein PilT [Acidimicrobiia bacterium]|nr:MAG: type IV pilus twitching motility protein PilT [Acidimicrobiia bacterium]